MAEAIHFKFDIHKCYTVCCPSTDNMTPVNSTPCWCNIWQ